MQLVFVTMLNLAHLNLSWKGMSSVDDTHPELASLDIAAA